MLTREIGLDCGLSFLQEQQIAPHRLLWSVPIEIPFFLILLFFLHSIIIRAYLGGV